MRVGALPRLRGNPCIRRPGYGTTASERHYLQWFEMNAAGPPAGFTALTGRTIDL